MKFFLLIITAISIIVALQVSSFLPCFMSKEQIFKKGLYDEKMGVIYLNEIITYGDDFLIYLEKNDFKKRLNTRNSYTIGRYFEAYKSAEVVRVGEELIKEKDMTLKTLGRIALVREGNTQESVLFVKNRVRCLGENLTMKNSLRTSNETDLLLMILSQIPNEKWDNQIDENHLSRLKRAFAPKN